MLLLKKSVWLNRILKVCLVGMAHAYVILFAIGPKCSQDNAKEHLLTLIFGLSLLKKFSG